MGFKPLPLLDSPDLPLWMVLKSNYRLVIIVIDYRAYHVHSAIVSSKVVEAVDLTFRIRIVTLRNPDFC